MEHKLKLVEEVKSEGLTAHKSSKKKSSCRSPKRREEETLLLTQFSIDHASDSIFWIMPNAQFSYVNEASCRMLGYSSHELLSMSIFDIDPHYGKETGRRLWSAIKERGSMIFETQFCAKDKRMFDVEVTGNYVQFRSREYVLFFARNITDRKRAEEAIYAEKERLTVTLHSIGDGVIATDRSGRITLINTVAEKLTGWSQEEAMGRRLEEVFCIINEKTRDGCENPVTKVLKTGSIVGLANHTVLISRDGSERAIADSGAPIRRADGTIMGVVLVFRDVTERKRTEEELLRISKLESIGVLAGGIAHDFNNLLSVILGNVSLARMYVGKDNNRVLNKCRDGERAVLRAKDLTHQLLTFSKGGAPIKKTSSVGDMLKESARFILAGSNIRCEFNLSPDLSPTEIDEGQISQVLSNLVINAQQAMPHGGEIHIHAENITLTESMVKHGFPLSKGEYVKIRVKDQGIGISREHLSKIFDPYFTTKQQGSGLGLAMVYSIVKNHDGHITVESVSGKGTVFTIYLPASKGHPFLLKETEKRLVAGKGRVLVVDDEEMIREIAGEMLDSLGYEAGFAESGEEALSLYIKSKESDRPFDAVLLDLIIPRGIGGSEVIRRLLEIDPGVKAIVSSGYSNDPIMASYLQHGFKGAITKPYRLQELSEELSKLIDG